MPVAGLSLVAGGFAGAQARGGEECRPQPDTRRLESILPASWGQNERRFRLKWWALDSVAVAIE